MDEVNCLEMKSVPIKSTKLSERTAGDNPAMTATEELIKDTACGQGKQTIEPSCVYYRKREKRKPQMDSNSKRIPSTLREKQHKSQADFFRRKQHLLFISCL